MFIRKRDGRIVSFDTTRIVDAIAKAAKETDPSIDRDTILKAAWHAASNVSGGISDIVDVEKVQDSVIHALNEVGLTAVAKKYKSYRASRTRIRRNRSELIREIGKKVAASDVQNQNANVDEYSFGGRRGEAADVLLKQYALDNCVSEMARMNHVNNEIYIHDLNSYAVGLHNCISIPFDDLLANGFKTRQTDVRPANSINTAFQLVAVIFQLQSLQQFGGCSATHLDWTMVPYVRKSFYKHFIDGMKYIVNIDYAESPTFKPEEFSFDYYKRISPEAYKYAMDMTERELKQAVEGMYHNLNTLQSRAGDQLECWLRMR